MVWGAARGSFPLQVEEKPLLVPWLLPAAGWDGERLQKKLTGALSLHPPSLASSPSLDQPLFSPWARTGLSSLAFHHRAKAAPGGQVWLPRTNTWCWVFLHLSPGHALAALHSPLVLLQAVPWAIQSSSASRSHSVRRFLPPLPEAILGGRTSATGGQHTAPHPGCALMHLSLNLH